VLLQRNDGESTNSKIKDIVVTQKLTLKDLEVLNADMTKIKQMVMKQE
jgi:hypothetical protein